MYMFMFINKKILIYKLNMYLFINKYIFLIFIYLISINIVITLSLRGEGGELLRLRFIFSFWTNAKTISYRHVKNKSKIAAFTWYNNNNNNKY